MSCDFPTTKGVLRKLGGDKISGKVYTFNGDTTGLETGYYNGIQLVMLADEYFDPNTIERIAVSVGGSVVELSKDQFWIEEVSDAIATAHVVLTEFQGATVPIALIQKSNDGSQKSFSVLADPKYNAFVARIKFADTIVPINPKYLPTGGGSGGLPVVEITTLPTLGAVPLSDAENAKLNEMAEIGTPFFAKIFLEGTALTAPVIVAEVEGMIVGYFLSLPREFGMSVGVQPAEDGWELFAEPVT